MRPRFPTRSRVALAALLCFAHVTWLEATPLPDKPYQYQASNKPLEEVLADFAGQQGLSLALSAHVGGVVEGRFSTRTGQEFIDRLASHHSFVWYVHANTLFVSNAANVFAKIIPLAGLSPRDLRSALTSLGLLEPKFGWGELPDKKLVFVSGPASYVGLIAVTTQELVAATQNQPVLASAPVMPAMAPPSMAPSSQVKEVATSTDVTHPIVPTAYLVRAQRAQNKPQTVTAELPPLPSGLPPLPSDLSEYRRHQSRISGSSSVESSSTIPSFEQGLPTATYESGLSNPPARRKVVTRTARKDSTARSRLVGVDLDEFANRLAQQTTRQGIPTVAFNTGPTGLDARELTSLNPTQFKTLSPQQVANLTAAQIKVLSPAHVAALGGKVTALSTSALRSLSPAQFNAIDTNDQNKLSEAQWDVVIAARMAAIAPADLATSSAAQLAALSDAHVAGITAQQIAALNTQQIAALGPRLARLNPVAAAAVPPTDRAFISRAVYLPTQTMRMRPW